MPENQIFDVRADVDQSAKSRLDRNRLWWERMPMTYAAWDASDRLPQREADYREMESFLLANSPFLSEFFATTEFANQKVLDLGCGAGVLSCLLARKGAAVTATDITAQAMALTAENASVQDLPMGIVRTNAESMGFADASFDYVLSWGVVHHSPNTGAALEEVARVLKPGGRGLIMVYHKSSLVYYLRGLYWLIVRGKLLKGYTLKTVQDFCVDGYYHRHFGKKEMARCLREAGLQPARVFATQQNTPLIPGIVGSLDRFLKKSYGWYLVAEIERPA